MNQPENIGSDKSPNPLDDILKGAVQFMTTHGITAELGNDLGLEGPSHESIILTRGGEEVAHVAFVDGERAMPDRAEIRRRLEIRGLIDEVIVPLKAAAFVLYEDKSDLLDHRLDVLPGIQPGHDIT